MQSIDDEADDISLHHANPWPKRRGVAAGISVHSTAPEPGRVSSRFAADIEAVWSEGRGTMVEDFRYDSGATQHREWSLTLAEDGSIRPEGEDVVGAGGGSAAGPALRLAYRVRLPEASGGQVVSIVDWLYLLDNGTIVNRSQFRKFGFTVAEVVATFRPQGAVTGADTGG